MEKGLVSIVTPVYNAEEFINETIKSVLNQTYKQYEMILVDDCSTDQSAEIIQDIVEENEKIRYIRLKENSGAAVARNTGIENARGQFIAFLDSDDLWEPYKLSEQLKFMEKKDAGLTYTAFKTIQEDGSIINEEVVVPDRLNYSGLLKNTAIACSTVIINREKTGDFLMPLVRKGQDTATWLFLLRERIQYAYGFNKVLSSYRNVKGSISDNKVGALKRTWNTYHNIEKLPLYKSVYYFSWYMFNAVKKRL